MAEKVDSSQQLSFEQIASEVSPVLLRYLNRYVGDRQTAEDLLQETLLRMSRGLAGFAGRSSVKTWAFSIATHVAADYFRKPANRINIVEMDDTGDLPDPERMTDDHVVIDEMNACVRQVIDSLPDDYRSALVLHDLEGLTAAQVGDVCQCSVATAKIRIHRARLRLKTAMQEQCSFYRDEENVFRCERRPQERE